MASLVVVPASIAFGKQVLQIFRERRQAKLALVFITRQEVEMHFDELRKVQNEQHAENRDFLDTMRTEALQREGRITGAIEGMRSQSHDESRDLRAEVGKVHGRVDRVLELVNERRKS